MEPAAEPAAELDTEAIRAPAGACKLLVLSKGNVCGEIVCKLATLGGGGIATDEVMLLGHVAGAEATCCIHDAFAGTWFGWATWLPPS